MSVDAAQLGFDATVDRIRHLLAERFGDFQNPQTTPVDNPLFAISLGLSSLDGLEFLVELEKEFGVQIKDLDWWVYETPTLASVAHFVIKLSSRQHAT